MFVGGMLGDCVYLLQLLCCLCSIGLFVLTNSVALCMVLCIGCLYCMLNCLDDDCCLFCGWCLIAVALFVLWCLFTAFCFCLCLFDSCVCIDLCWISYVFAFCWSEICCGLINGCCRIFDFYEGCFSVFWYCLLLFWVLVWLLLVSCVCFGLWC